MIQPYPIHLTPTVRVRLAALTTGYLVLGILGLHRYFYFSAEIILGLIAIMMTWDGGRTTKNNGAVYAIFGLAFACLYSLLASKSLLMAAIALSLLSLLQPFAGKPGWHAALSLILATPLFEYFSNVFSFPIRMQLTQIAGQLLTVMGTGYHAEGNMLMGGGAEFSVDPACMGLHMLTLSLLTGLILIGVCQQKYARRLRLPATSLLMLLLLLLNLVSNLFRIVLLVQFRIYPESRVHSLTGIACFCVYVLCPAWWLVHFTVRRFGEPGKTVSDTPVERQFSNQLLARHLALMLMIGAALLRSGDKSVNENLPLGSVEAPGYSQELLHDKIVKLTDPESLIYIKPIAGFYSADHQPGICWSGSGYAFSQVEEKKLLGALRYTARLEKDKDILYTAWWYDDGISGTTSQLEWRWDAFRYSRNYALVNITATTPAKLENEIRKFSQRDPCRRLLRN